MSDEAKVGIKETKELVIGANELAVLLVERLKDGFQVGEDVSAVIAKLSGDADFKAKMEAAYQGVGQVGAEAKDLDLAEGLELIMVQATYVPKIVAAAKKA